MRHLRRYACTFARNTLPDTLLHIRAKLSGLRRGSRYGEVGRMQQKREKCCIEISGRFQGRTAHQKVQRPTKDSAFKRRLLSAQSPKLRFQLRVS